MDYLPIVLILSGLWYAFWASFFKRILRKGEGSICKKSCRSVLAAKKAAKNNKSAAVLSRNSFKMAKKVISPVCDDFNELSAANRLNKANDETSFSDPETYLTDEMTPPPSPKVTSKAQFRNRPKKACTEKLSHVVMNYEDADDEELKQNLSTAGEMCEQPLNVRIKLWDEFIKRKLEDS